MRVIDFDDEEIEIKKKIEKARHNISEVEDLSDFDSKSKKPAKDKKQDDEELEQLTPKEVAKEIFSIIFNVIMCFVIVFLITHFLGQRTVVSGQSMMDTLYDKDNLIVDKISYRFHDPERFDVIVFPPKEDEGAFYIKRVIGLPGETVRIDSSGNIYINDQILEENYGTEVINNPGNAIDDIHLGEDEFFVLGDNRNNSRDSRWLGPIKGEEFTGRAWIRFYPFNKAGLVENIK